MGLSSNARLLSLTARLTSNEYESQQISNAKTRLAIKSQQVSEDFIQALNSPSYNFVTYASTGDAVRTKLTADALYQYADAKNQYMLSNSSGKALISSRDAKNFEKSANLVDFLKCYDLAPEYKSETLGDLYDKIKIDMDFDGSCKSWNETLAQIKYDVDRNNCSWTSAAWQNEAYGDKDNPGAFELYRNALGEYNTAIEYLNEGENIDIEEISAQKESLGLLKENAENCASYDTWLEAMARKFANESTTLCEDDLDNFNTAYNNLSSNISVTNKPYLEELLNELKSIHDGVKNSENSDEYSKKPIFEIKEDDQNTIQSITYNKTELNKSLYYTEDSEQDSFKIEIECAKIIEGKNGKINLSIQYDKLDIEKDSDEDNYIKTYINTLNTLIEKFKATGTVNNSVNLNDLKKQKSNFTDKIGKLDNFRENVALYEAELEKLDIEPSQAYTYQDKNKAQWYTNLWYRLNGQSTVKNPNAQYNYSVLDSKLMSSSTWVIDALKQGAISIEHASASNCQQVLVSEDNPILFNLTGVKWNSKMYSSCSDIVEADNSEVIAHAEAVYKRENAEITVQDQKLQRQLSKLDSEHTALQTEYESIKNAVSKNIERSYKTFNG